MMAKDLYTSMATDVQQVEAQGKTIQLDILELNGVALAATVANAALITPCCPAPKVNFQSASGFLMCSCQKGIISVDGGFSDAARILKSSTSRRWMPFK